jgi:3-oxoacyl-[acyl-carrier-protein] synthase-3
MTTYAKVIGTGGYLPAEIKSNEDISKLVDTSDSWIFERTGIKNRRIAAADETTSSMAEIAARQAIEMADIAPNEIDLIVVATGTPENVYPGAACMLQYRLGIKNGVAFDIQAACSGSVFGLDIANQYFSR